MVIQQEPNNNDRLKNLELSLSDNTELTQKNAEDLQALSENIKEMLEVFGSIKDSLKILIIVGKIAKWLAPILAVVAYFWAFFSGKTPPIGK